MIALSRAAARSFRAVALKCVAGRPSGPAPVVVLTRHGGIVSLSVEVEGVVLRLDLGPDARADESLGFPLAVLADVGGGSGVAELDRSDPRHGIAEWHDRAGPKSVAFDSPVPARWSQPVEQPATWSPPQPRLLPALAACTKSTTRESSRFALDRVQLRGAAGDVVGTDGRAAVVARGLTFPIAGDVLVPAVPVYAAKELAAAGAARVGLVNDAVVLQAGPWTLRLPAGNGRYPDVAGVVPKGVATVIGLDDRDAETVSAALADVTGDAVTLDADGRVIVRARCADEVVAWRLERSPTTGPAVRAALDRNHLARALSLGCRTVRLHGDDRPAVFEGGGFTVVAMTLHPSSILPPNPNARLTPADLPDTGTRPSSTSATPRTTVMKTHPPPPAEPAPEPPDGDPLAEAEALRALLVTAAGRAARLVAALRHRRRERKALSQAWSSLKSLNLTPE